MKHSTLRTAEVCPLQIRPDAFVKKIWQNHQEGSWLFLAAKQDPRWIEHPIKNDSDRDRNIREFFSEYPKRKWDLYFCPNAFMSSKRRKPKAFNTPYAWCDIDEADPSQFVPPPSVLWESSPGRFQGIWRFNRRLRPIRAERISRYLAHEFGADRSGWEVTKVLRIPGTYNHKRDGKPPKVKLLKCDLSRIDPRPLLKLAPKIRAGNHVVDSSDFDLDRDPTALFKKYRKLIRHVKTRMMLRHRKVLVRDRSVQIFTMMKGLFEAQIPWDDIACLIWHSPYFQSKHGTNQTALEAEIQRAMNKFDIGE